jgi:cytochrome c-type biogenesis protein
MGKKNIWWVLVVLIVFIVTSLGYKVWSIFIAPQLSNLDSLSFPILMVFAFTAGMVSFFSPCAFPLFPGYIAYYLGDQKKRNVSSTKIGLLAASGALTFFGILAVILFFVGNVVLPYLSFLASLTGLLIAIFGLMLLIGISFKSSYLQNLLSKLKSKNLDSNRDVFLFGFGYGVISKGCTLPLIIALILIPLGNGQIGLAAVSILVYGMAMSILMIIVTYLVFLSRDKLIRKLNSSTVNLKKLAGVLLMIIGLYLAWYNYSGGMLL